MSTASAEAGIERDLRRLYDGSGIAGLTEAQLLDRVARRDEAADAAFEAIVTRHGPPVVASAVAAIAQVVVRALVSAVAIKTAVLFLAVASFLSAGAAIAVLTFREAAFAQELPPLHREAGASPHASKVDRYGDPLPEGAIARLGTTRFRHNYFGGNWTTVRRVLYSPDGRSLVTVAAGEAHVWDVASPHLIRTIEADLAELSPDGKTLFAAKSAVHSFADPKPGNLRAIDFSSGRDLRQVGTAAGEPCDLLTVSPDGKSVAAVLTKGFAYDKALPSAAVVYDAVTLVERRRIAIANQHARGLAFSTDSRLLAVATPEGDALQFNRQPTAGSVRIYEAATGALVRRFSIEGSEVGSLAFTPDGKTLAAGVGDWSIRLYDLATGRERLPRLRRADTTPTPTMGPGAIEGTQRPRAAACLAFSPDGSLLASGLGWGGSQNLLKDWPSIILWDVAAAREIRRFGGHPYQICALAFSPDGRRLASSGGEPQARNWDVATGGEVSPRAGHPHGIFAMAVSPADGTVFTLGNDDGLVIHWDPTDGRALEALPLNPQRYTSLAVSPDGRTLAIGETGDGQNHGLILWNIAGHTELRRFKAAPGCEPTFSPDGRRVALGFWVYDVASGKRIDGFSTNPAVEAWFTPDGRRLISVAPGGVHLSDFVAGVEVKHAVQANLNTWFNAAVSPDGRLVATGNLSKKQPRGDQDADDSDPAIRVRELASGKEVAKLVGHVAQSNNLVFSPDGRMLASVSGAFGGEADPGLRVWDVATSRQLRRFSYFPNGANTVAFLPDGRAIVTASGVDGMAIVWDISDLADRRPTDPPDAKTLEALWADLASDDARRAFRASWALSIEGAVPFLSDRLHPAAPNGPTSGPEVLRALRAIAALERVASTRARDILEALARGDSAAPATEDAAAALLRLSRRKSR